MSFSRHVSDRLRQIFGESGLLTSPADLVAYSFDATTNWQELPEIVVFPTTTEQVSQMLVLADEEEIPVTVRGAGTNLSGGSIPVSGGIVMCTARMNQIVHLNTANFTATVQAGVVLNDLNQKLAQHGLFFPPDPQSFLAATIGGCVSENASGPSALKYGVFRHYLLGLTVVLPSGEVLKFGGNTMKNVTGYDLPQLICGSEGTLAVITEVTLRLLTCPPSDQTVLAVFDQVVNAGRAVSAVRSGGILPAKIEMMDNWLIRRIEEKTPLGLPLHADAILLIQLDGWPESVIKESQIVIDLCKKAGAVEVRAAENAEEAGNFWEARRAGFSTIYGQAPTVLSEDITVPCDKIPQLIERVQQLSEKHDLTIVMVGHAGDGNLHPCILTDKEDTHHYGRAETAMGEIFNAALEFGGAISGEHGIGLEKRQFLKFAMAPKSIELLKGIKKVFDPKGILNPGKIWE
ncbi:FAD-binding oxidoreductase [Thermodesulfobacteriota bacterium]